MTADANRAEALTCLDRAREALRMGDHAKAKRMLQKAKSLDPKQDVSFLLKKAETMSGGAETSSNDTADDRSYAHDDHYEDTNNLRSRKAHKSPSRGNTANGTTSKETKPRSASRTPKLGVDYTKEQLELVERIRHCKDYYEILRVTKTASDAEIKKEYRKMALQLHPDKCRAPHATEAFKALGNAYAILADADKRRQYDTYGADAPRLTVISQVGDIEENFSNMITLTVSTPISRPKKSSTCSSVVDSHLSRSEDDIDNSMLNEKSSITTTIRMSIRTLLFSSSYLSSRFLYSV